MSIISSIDVHKSAIEDLHNLKASDLEAFSDIVVLIQELKVDPDETIDWLTTHGDTDANSFDINAKQWLAVRKIANNLWRLRLLGMPGSYSTAASKYRIIYGYHYQTRQLCILAIVKREEFDYDDLTTPINQRIIRDWNAI